MSPSSTPPSGSAPAVSGSRRQRPSDFWESATAGIWLIGLIAGPLFGYYLTGVTGWTDAGNWRMMMWLRLGACFLWPVGAALVHGLVKVRTVPKFRWTGILGLMLVSSYGGYIGWNAAMDLRDGPQRVERIVAAKDLGVGTVGYASRQSYTYYTVRLVGEDHTFYVTEENYHGLQEGDSCMATLLPHTQRLLDVWPK